MRIALYFDLPNGGALRTMEEEIEKLKLSHEIEIYHNQNPVLKSGFLKRFILDFESIVIQRFKQQKQARQIDKENYDLVYVSHDRHFQAPWILRYLKTPTVFLCQEPTRAFFEQFLSIDPHLPPLNYFYESVIRAIKKNIEIKNASFADTIVANSKYSSESIFRAYGQNSVPIHLGVDLNQYFPEMIKKKNQIFVVGNNEPQKNLQLAILSLAKIPPKERPILVIACPRNNDLSALKKMAQKLKVKCRFLTGLDRSEMRHQYNLSLITLAVARLEPFGLSVVESLACCTPVVALDEGGFKESIIHQKSGLLVNTSPANVAQAILKLTNDDELRNKMGQFGFDDVSSRLTWDHHLKQLQQVFYETINQERKS